jgi:ABC-type transport system substrate-binding protein
MGISGNWTRRLLGAALLPLIGVALLSLGCGGKPKSKGMEYHFALSSVKGFDPAVANDVPSSRVLGAMFEGLYQYHYLDRPYRVIPAVAEGMPEVSKDRLEYTFKIKKGVRFHDDPCFKGKTRFLTAQDFVYAWKRLADPKTAATGWWTLDGWIVGLNKWRDAASKSGSADYTQEVPGLRATDDHTLVVKLTKPYPQFLYILTMSFTVPLAQEVVEFYGKDLLNHPIGTGPYVLKKYATNSRIVLDKNPNFREEHYPTTGSKWAQDHGMLKDAGKRLPFLDRIVYKIIIEPQPLWLEFRRGDLDRASIPKDNFDSAMATSTELAPDLKKEGVQLQVWPSQTMWWIGMNAADDDLKGEKGLHLRRAIAYSHDAKKFLKVIRNGRGELADSIIPPMMAAYDKKAITARYDFNLDKAREELKLAGYPDGKGAPALRFDIRGAGSTSRQIAEFVQRGMQEIGLKVSLVSNTFPQFLRKANAGQLQVFWGGWVGDYPDEENWLQLLYGPNGMPGPNYANFKNAEYDALYEKIRIMADSPERRKMIHRMENLALDACVWRMSFVSTDYVIYHRWLKNFTYADPIYNWQKYLRIDSEDRAKGIHLR